MDETLRDLADYIALKLEGKIVDWHISLGELCISTKPSDNLEVLRFLRDDQRLKFVSFIDVTAVDYPERDARFEVVYHLLSPKQNARVRVKTSLGANTQIKSICGLFPGANWCERETYDMYGILFSGHPDLRRLLTDYGFDGHPLRKDFPLSGHYQVRYDDEKKRVVREPVKLSQAFRDFDFLSPWEGVDYALPGDEKANGQKQG
ncbi:NADH-quinone oxidoreductase subunit C [uncultured Cohaesibacter sp.]|uniref:NADH-quinone oxidoreductase subunit C n=1 Tax=uncultured Cohaesibacter sp. TaxID=1002546 RepID=UPI00292D7757|nr:NADH-quinone oxidoreductase subunit C [uncultured Cohaesibacter sp.]